MRLASLGADTRLPKNPTASPTASPTSPGAACLALGGNLGWVADGYCDRQNNKVECGWDGGDCCKQTCGNADCNGWYTGEFNPYCTNSCLGKWQEDKDDPDCCNNCGDGFNCQDPAFFLIMGEIERNEREN